MSPRNLLAGLESRLRLPSRADPQRRVFAISAWVTLVLSATGTVTAFRGGMSALAALDLVVARALEDELLSVGGLGSQAGLKEPEQLHAISRVMGRRHQHLQAANSSLER